MTGSVVAAGAAVAAAFDETKVTPGLAGFLVFAGLAFATWLLLRSFTRHLGRVHFDDDGDVKPRRGAVPGPPADAHLESRKVPPPRG